MKSILVIDLVIEDSQVKSIDLVIKDNKVKSIHSGCPSYWPSY